MFIQGKSSPIPSEVLKGQIPYFLPVHNLFINLSIQGLMKRIYNSYYQRSHLDTNPSMDWKKYRPKMGRADDQGKKWVQLSPRTYAIKKMMAQDDVLKDYLTSQRSRAAESTLKRLVNISFADGDGINIRTGRLLAAYFPPPVSGGRIYATADQVFTKDEENVAVEILVKHDDDVQASERKIWTPESVTIWMGQAQDEAIGPATALYATLRDSNKNPFSKRPRLRQQRLR